MEQLNEQIDGFGKCVAIEMNKHLRARLFVYAICESRSWSSRCSLIYPPIWCMMSRCWAAMAGRLSSRSSAVILNGFGFGHQLIPFI